MYTKVARRMPQESLLAFQHIVKNIMHLCFVTYKNFQLCLGKVHPFTQTLWAIFEQMHQLPLAISPMSFNVAPCLSPFGIPPFPLLSLMTPYLCHSIHHFQVFPCPLMSLCHLQSSLSIPLLPLSFFHYFTSTSFNVT